MKVDKEAFNEILKDKDETDKLFIGSMVELVIENAQKNERSSCGIGYYIIFGIIIVSMGIGVGVDWIRNVGIGSIIIGLIFIPINLEREKIFEAQKQILKDYIFALKKKDN